jgi:hypothetical protein
MVSVVRVQQPGHDAHDQGLEDEDATAHDPDTHLDRRPHEGEARLVDEVGRPSGGCDGGGRVDLTFFLKCLLEVDDPDDAHNGDKASADKGSDKDDLLPKWQPKRSQYGQGEQQDGEVGEDIDGRR